MKCPCGNNLPFIACCEKIHNNPNEIQTAEMLMRARYSAFTVHNIDFIYQTFHPSTRRYQQQKDIEQWAKENKWMQLEIIKTTPSTVEFKAFYLDKNLNTQVHHEKSTFKKFHEQWYYLDGILIQ